MRTLPRGDALFGKDIYERRREALLSRFEAGLLLFPGHRESPINYADNAYPFRQDSSFLYYFGLDQPDLAAVMDADAGTVTLFGDDPTIDHVVWMGALPTIAERAERVGVRHTRPWSALAEVVGEARRAGRPVRFLPPYRAETSRELAGLLDVPLAQVAECASLELVLAVVDQRAHKAEEEVRELEDAVATSVAMHAAAIRMTRPGITEAHVAAEVERVAVAAGGRTSYPVIATVRGEILHNHFHGNTLAEGDLFLLDAGAESAAGYAGDLTSTFPVGRRFEERQRTVYEVVLSAYDAAVSALAPGVSNRDVHFAACRAIFEGMKALGVMKGDTEEALAEGAHALVMPHGIGHMIGLDVHDMESLGEDHVGYAGEPRSEQFGLRSLRLARPLEPGFGLTVEPGVYFIPKLIDLWRSRRHCAAFVDYDEIERWKGFGGVRNEENYLVTTDGARRLGPRKPSTSEEIEGLRG